MAEATPEPEPAVRAAPENVKPEESHEEPKGIYRYFPTYDSLSESDKKEAMDWLIKNRSMIDALKKQEDKSQKSLTLRYCPHYFDMSLEAKKEFAFWVSDNSKWLMLTIQQNTQEQSVKPEVHEMQEKVGTTEVPSESTTTSELSADDDLWQEDEDEYRELKTQRTQLVFPPTLFRKVKKRAKKLNLSMNEFVCMILQAVVGNDPES